MNYRRSVAWVRVHDPHFAALRRAARTAIVMPGMFALGVEVIENPAVATFAAFGSFAMLLLVDFQGALRDRLLNQAALAVTCAGMIIIATLVSETTWLAAVTMAAVGFGVLFVGVASSVLAGATQTLLLAFILPVSLAAPASTIPDRLAGWGMAAGCSLLAIWFLWPLPARDPVRTEAISACRAMAARLRAETALALGGGDPAAHGAFGAAAAASDDAVDALYATFYATPFRPTGLSTSARAVVRLVDELRWLNEAVVHAAPAMPAGEPSPAVWAVKDAAAGALEAAADVLERPTQVSPSSVPAALQELDDALAQLERHTTIALPDGRERARDADARAVISSLNPSFRSQELSFVVAQIASNAGAAAAAERRTWMQRLLGRQPPGLPGALTAAQRRAGAHLVRRSVWLQNSLRGGAGLGIAVLVADLSSVQQAFWVVLGALSVLRSSALTTGQNILRAIGGTAAGFALGGTLVWLIGTDTTLLWVLLPVSILLAGLAPAAVSFGAGQAAFTLTVLIIFNILRPVGWSLGLVRIEDVALGCAVSLVVGLLLWPRGAAAALGRALSQAYTDCAAYLARTVDYGVGRCDASAVAAVEPVDEASRAAASSRRLDDTFRGYLSERGAKPLALAEITHLLTGVVALRLAGDAVLELWSRADAAGAERGAARRELVEGALRLTGWYGDFATSLAGGYAIPDPLPPDEVANGRLVEAVRRDLRDEDGQATATAVRVIWTGDHLDAARRLQNTLVAPARAAVEGRALS
jgi:uncharacterized membrane protein YccC